MNDDGASAHLEVNLPEEATVWPVYAGKSLNLWQPDTGKYYDSANAANMISHLQEKRLAQYRHQRSGFSEQEESTINDPATLPCRHPRIAFRNVTNPTNTRTLVAALVPGDRVITNGAPYLLQVRRTATDEAYVLGVLCSMICDWQARRTVELNMTFELLNAFSIPDPGTGHPVRDRVVVIAGRLAAVDERFSEWAAQVGVTVGSANHEKVKQDLIAELDACVGYLYGLDEDDLHVIFDTFSRTKDYSNHCAAVIAHFRQLHD